MLRPILFALSLTAAGAMSLQAAELTIACGGVPENEETCARHVRAWAAATGHTVEVVRASSDSSVRFEQYQDMFARESDAFDVVEIDTIHTGAFAEHLVDLREYLGSGAGAGHDEALLDNNTVGGRLVALPWQVGIGLLYFRYDLLMRYDQRLPRTWPEVMATARLIQERERERTGNEDFYGFVFEGEAYEGLTANALEWIIANGGNNLVDDDGGTSINTVEAAEALEMAASWIGDISPPRVVGFTEEAARLAFQRGDAAFMRNWPYAYRLMIEDRNSPTAGLFLAAPMPGDGGELNHASVLGGWQLAVNRYSRHRGEAASLVQYLTSELIQRERAMTSGLAPTFPSLYGEREVLRANPVFAALLPMVGRAIARPADVVGRDYMAVSELFSRHVHSVLTGDVSAPRALERVESDLAGLRNDSWGGDR